MKGDIPCAGGPKLLYGCTGYTAACLNNDLTIFFNYILPSFYTYEKVADLDGELIFYRFVSNLLKVIEYLHELIGGVAHGSKQSRGREFPAPIDADVNMVLGIQLKV